MLVRMSLVLFSGDPIQESLTIHLSGYVGCMMNTAKPVSIIRSAIDLIVGSLFGLDDPDRPTSGLGTHGGLGRVLELARSKRSASKGQTIVTESSRISLKDGAKK